MKGFDRPWQVGILYNAGDNRFARAMLAAFAADPALTVGDNEPYAMDVIDYTVPVHAYPRRLPYAEIEIRQDLLGDDAGVADWCGRVEQALIAAARSFGSLDESPRA
jgi:predicted N-formylglutamate amidohydrolase